MKKTGDVFETVSFSEIDLQFARFATKLAGEDSPLLFYAAALASRAIEEGDVCLDLSALAGLRLVSEMGEWTCPDLSEWASFLKGTGVVGRPGDFFPLVLDAEFRLYLYRYWEYEKRLADEIEKRAEGVGGLRSEAVFQRTLLKLFPKTSEGETDWQKVAAFMALTRKFAIISGGPGTGKSTLIAKVLAILLEQSERPNDFRIALCAPTGKAAVRMQDAIKGVKERLPVAAEIKEAIPIEASTIHRLLGSIPGSPYFRRNSKNPLQADLVVVDEASMVPMALMSKLVQALKPESGLILLGDENQLSSVEAGAVLGDLCNRGRAQGFSIDFCARCEALAGEKISRARNGSGGPAIQDCVVKLRRNYRFGKESGIGALSDAVNRGNGPLALELMKSDALRDISWRELPSPSDMQLSLKGTALHAFGRYASVDPAEFFPLFERFRVLCALRRGPYGVEALNALTEKILRTEGLIGPEAKWRPGRPIMIARNDYNQNLFNGDVGVVLPDADSGGQMRAFFLSKEGSLRRSRPPRLPEHETAFAMTVHKSQGSEFDNVLLILPDSDTPVLTRELIYTAVTRARLGVEIWGAEEVFLKCVDRRIDRSSGLRAALWSVKA